VPIGHKIALKDIKAGDTAIKYGEDIGKFVADMSKGRTRPHPQSENQALVGASSWHRNTQT
jgi:altronate dehydratase